MISITKYKALFIGIALAMIAGSFATISIFGLKQGIDFTGGTIIDLDFASSSPKFLLDADLKDVASYDSGDGSIRLVSSRSYDDLIVEVRQVAATGTLPFAEKAVNTVGPTLGAEMKKKALIGIAVAILAILAFIAFAFRHVSQPVASWKYGLIAIVTLLHDIVIPTAVYSYLSHLLGLQVDTLFVVALLTILGISISDKIVVFDRIRENLKSGSHKAFNEVVDISLRQTFTRSINTSVTVVLALLALFVYGPESTKYFSLILMIGMVVGTYSSIFVASNLLTLVVPKSKK